MSVPMILLAKRLSACSKFSWYVLSDGIKRDEDLSWAEDFVVPAKDFEAVFPELALAYGQVREVELGECRNGHFLYRRPIVERRDFGACGTFYESKAPTAYGISAQKFDGRLDLASISNAGLPGILGTIPVSQAAWEGLGTGLKLPEARITPDGIPSEAYGCMRFAMDFA